MQVRLVVPPNTEDTGSSKPGTRSRMFPVLVFLLLACYGLMTLVVIEQGKVIQSQRGLIAQLSQDSQQLIGMKNQEMAQHAIEKKQAETRKKMCHNCAVPVPKEQASDSTKEQAQKLLGRKSVGQKSKIEKQPLQADDKVDRRRFPSQI